MVEGNTRTQLLNTIRLKWFKSKFWKINIKLTHTFILKSALFFKKSALFYKKSALFCCFFMQNWSTTPELQIQIALCLMIRLCICTCTCILYAVNFLLQKSLGSPWTCNICPLKRGMNHNIIHCYYCEIFVPNMRHDLCQKYCQSAA